MEVNIKTYIQTYPINEYVLVDVNRLDYVKNLYEHQYKTIRGAVYGAVSFTIDGQEIMMSSHNIDATWQSLTSYLLTKQFNYKQKFFLYVDDHDVKLINGCDKNNPQIRLKYNNSFTDWMSISTFREALLTAFMDYMEIVNSADTETCIDEEGDSFEYPPELKGVKENYQELKNSFK